MAVIEAPPFGMKGADGAPVGAAVDVAVALGKRVSMTVEPMLLPRVRVPTVMAEGQAAQALVADGFIDRSMTAYVR